MNFYENDHKNGNSKKRVAIFFNRFPVVPIDQLRHEARGVKRGGRFKNQRNLLTMLVESPDMVGSRFVTPPMTLVFAAVRE